MKLYGVSSHVVFLLTFAFEGCARSGRERPIHLSKLPVLAAMPKRFCNNHETSELFRLGSIIRYLRLHGTYSGYALHSQRAGANLCSMLHLGIGHPPGCVGTSCGRSRTDQVRPMSVSTRSQISVLTVKRAAREASRLSRKHKAHEAIAKTVLMALVAAIAVQRQERIWRGAFLRSAP